MAACMKKQNGRNKINYNKTPQYLAELFPKTVGTRHTHNTRQIHNIVNINCQTSLYSEYFLPSTIKAWNDLPLINRALNAHLFIRNLVESPNCIWNNWNCIPFLIRLCTAHNSKTTTFLLTFGYPWNNLTEYTYFWLS